MTLIDLTRVIEDGMPVYPGDAGTRLYQVKHLAEDHYNNYSLEAGMHAGTHVDSPMHLTGCARLISEAPPDSFIGRGCLINAADEDVIGMKAEYRDSVPEGGIVLLYTGWDKLYGTDAYYENAPCVSMELCEFLISKKIKMLGMDLASPDRYPFEIHKALFARGIHVLENLTNLGKLTGINEFEVIALPLRIKADSSPVRAVAVVR